MNSSEFKVSQLKLLGSILKLAPEHILEISKNCSYYYTEKVEFKLDRHSGQQKFYNDGAPKTRIIRPSHGDLKTIQKSIKKNILDKIKFYQNVQGGVKGKSNISNAKLHQGKKYIFTTDLQNFFPNINHSQVYLAFLNLGYSTYLSSLLTKLTTYKYELPQGIPVSTHIANLVFSPVDKKLIELAREHDLTYSRFVDDITFSSQKDFKFLHPQILKIISCNGMFKINYRKTKYAGQQNITGIDVYINYIDAPERIKRSVKEEKKCVKKPYLIYYNSIRSTNKNLETRVEIIKDKR